MLKRFKRLTGIGRFSDTDVSGRSFHQKTIIFGNNGQGKSTLTAILRSLSTNDSKLLKQRRTFGSSTNQKAQIVFGDTDNNDVIYENGVWNNTDASPEINIFDGKFIAQNIFDGEQLAETHKANLHRVVIGAEGKVLAQEIKDIKVQINGLDADLDRIRQQYARSSFSGVFTLDQFKEIAQDENIDAVIADLEAKTRFSKIPAMASIATIEFDTVSLRAKLSEDLQQTHETAKAQVMAHIQSHWNEGTGRIEFLEEGLSLMQKTCPFCGQSIESVITLIDSYKDFFDEAYKQWLQGIRSNVDAFKRWNLALKINQVEAQISAWSEFIPAECEELISWLNTNKPSLLQAKETFDQQCTSKGGDLAHKVDFSSLLTLEEILNELNARVPTLNNTIESFKASATQDGLADLQAELNRSRIAKDRCTDQWVEFCDEYGQLKESRGQQVAVQNQKLAELQEYSSATLANHQTKINEILDTLGADFRIDNLAERTDRRRSDAISCGFNLKFFNVHDVSIESDDDESPTFHNTLSQGDKNLLAFAFFVSSLSNASDLSKTIVVIDDPISSFDHERKQGTVSILSRLADAASHKPEQIIILTHETGFLDKIYNHPHFADAKYLRIKQDGVDENDCKKSTLADCDPWDNYLRPKQLKYLEDIKSFIDGNSQIPGDAHDKCRQILESIFRTKYHLELKHLGRGSSIGDYTQTLKGVGIYDEQNCSEFDEIKGKLHEPHHAQESPASTDSEGDISFILRETLRVAKLI